ncbi:MAG: hypothetical protein R3D67_11960 [Hyphomicrobiaceae bacterium]
MSRAEIRAKFDEIVAFAESRRFLDTPVEALFQHVCPPGVRGRSHLEPVLIVDEVPSPSSAEFQRSA